jgi:hypothetical protein
MSRAARFKGGSSARNSLAPELPHIIYTSRSCHLPGPLGILSVEMKKSLLVETLGKSSLFGAAILLMASPFVAAEAHAYVSSLPLALAGLGYTLLQVQLRPPRRVLVKRLLLAAAFLLWAIVQLLPPGRIAVFMGDLVIAAYVADLFWMMQDQRDNDLTPAPGHTARIGARSCAD